MRTYTSLILNQKDILYKQLLHLFLISLQDIIIYIYIYILDIILLKVHSRKKYHMTLIENKRPILIDFKQLFNRNKIIQTIFSVMYFNITKMELFSKIHLKPCDCFIKTSVGTRVGRRAQISIIRDAGCERQIRRTLRHYCSRSFRQIFCKQIFVKS